MTAHKSSSKKAADLRRRVEESLRKKAEQSLQDIASLSSEEILKILHELRVHQVELEMQNEELQHTQFELKTARERYFKLYDLAPMGYLTLSEQGLILEANLTATRLLGVARGALVKLPFSRFVFKEDQDIYYLHRKLLFESGEPQGYDLRMVKRDGTTFWAHLAGTAVQGGEGAHLCCAMISDITERKRAEEDLRLGQQQYRDMFESNTAIKLLIDPIDGAIVKANQAAARFYGWPINLLETMKISQINTLTPDQINAELRHASSMERTTFEFRHRLASGEIRDVEVYSSPIESDRRKLLFSIIHDITQRKQAEEKILALNAELEKQSLVDHLSNIFNHRYFILRGTEEINRTIRSKQPLVLLMLDIDEFKIINDTLGHAAGDLAIQQIARALKANLREEDILARLGGDEFAILFPNTPLQMAAIMAERVRLSIAGMVFNSTEGVQQKKLTISIGAAAFTEDMSGIDDLLSRADVAMYHAKNNGRNCVKIYSVDMVAPHP